MKNYSQASQDLFVLSLFNDNVQRTFVDIGCYLPDVLNNTLLLEQKGWQGISIDIEDFSDKWKVRNTPFVCADALICDYKQLFKTYKFPNTIDYLSVDIEGEGLRYIALKRVLESGYDFKVITVEHDAYRGYNLTERLPQRQFLEKMGYLLLCSDVYVDNFNFPFEDWWINPKYIKEKKYGKYLCSNKPGIDIIKNI